MALTPQQAQTLKLQAQARGYDAQKTQKFLEFADSKFQEQGSSVVQPVAVPEPKKTSAGLPTFLKKIGSALISSEVGVGQSLSSGIIPHLGEVKDAQTAQETSDAALAKVAQTIREKKSRGEDVSHLLDYYKKMTGQAPAFDYNTINPASTKTNQQALAEVAGVGLDVLTAGSYGQVGQDIKALQQGAKVSEIVGNSGKLVTKALPSVIKGAAEVSKAGTKTVFEGIKEGAKIGAKSALLPGAAYGAVGAAKQNKGIGGIAVGALEGAATGAVVGGVLGGATGGISTYLENKQKLAEEVKRITAERTARGENAIPTSEATSSLPRRIDPKLTKDALKKGIEQENIDVIANADAQDLAAMRQMYKTAKDGSKDLVFAAKNHPEDAMGETFLNRIPILKQARQDVGKQLGDLVKSMPKDPTDVSTAYESFTSNLADAGVRVGKKGELNFAGSAYANDGAARNLLQGIYDDISPNKAGESLLTPQTINTIRQRIANDVDLSSKGAVGMSGNAERIMNGVRADLGDILSSYSDDYAKLNGEYSSLSDVLGRTNSILGKDFKLGNATADRKAGEVMRRVLGNGSAKPLQLVEDVDRLAKYYNPDVQGDIVRQSIFASYMNDLFGLQRQNSLAGQVQQANERTIQQGVGLAEDVANQNVGNLIGKGIIHGYRAIKGITPEKQQEVIAKMLGLGADATTEEISNAVSGKGGSVVKDFIKGINDSTPGLSTRSVTTARQIDELTKNEMVDAIDYLRLNQPYSQKQEELIGKLAEKYNITAKTPSAIATALEQLVEGTKTRALPQAGRPFSKAAEDFAIFTKANGAKDYSVPLSPSEYADDASALIKSTLPKKGLSLAEEAAQASGGTATRMFDEAQTKYEGLINAGSYEKALELANSLVAKTSKEESMKKSLINMAINYIKENNPNAAQIIGKITGAGLTAGAALMGARRNKK